MFSLTCAALRNGTGIVYVRSSALAPRHFRIADKLLFFLAIRLRRGGLALQTGASQIPEMARLAWLLVCVVVLVAVAHAQMTFTDNWQKRAAAGASAQQAVKKAYVTNSSQSSEALRSELFRNLSRSSVFSQHPVFVPLQQDMEKVTNKKNHLFTVFHGFIRGLLRPVRFGNRERKTFRRRARSRPWRRCSGRWRS